MRTIDVYKLNQLLFLEAGFIHLNTLLSGVFIPIWGLTFFFVAIATYFVSCFMGAILSLPHKPHEDFVDVIKSEEFPSSGKNLIYSLGIMMIIIPIAIFYNMELAAYPINSTLCTLAALLVGCIAHILATRNGSRAVALIVFNILSIPLTLLSLIAGAVVTIPMLFIYLYRRI